VPPPRFRAPVEAIRDALRLEVEATSLRRVAREVGMSPMGVRNFIAGSSSTSYSATVRKLNAWYVRHHASRHAFSPDAARAALSLLLEKIPEPHRDAIGARLLTVLADLHRELEVHPPEWLDRLLDGPRADSGADPGANG
jgi:AcrR family transcriptional regulator